MFPLSYTNFNISSFSKENYSLIPIRYEDREKIRQWRNEQIDILRQKEPLSQEKQNDYFLNVVAVSFTEKLPQQLLFSFFEDDEIIGYGGLVHIDWRNRNAEISFLLDTARNTQNEYLSLFGIYLELIKRIAKALSLHKVYTFGYSVAEYRFEPLPKSGFTEEVILKKHILIDGDLRDIRIYGKIIS